MKLSVLFKHIKTFKDWSETGFKVNYHIEVDNDVKCIRLLFQDSKGFLDWTFNLIYFARIYKTIYKRQESEYLKAHIGIVSAYRSAKDKIMKELMHTISLYPEYSVVIAGWSHGGGLAQLAAEDLNYRTRTEKVEPKTGIKPILITYGSLNVYSGENCIEYVRSCCSKIYEIAQINDIVTYLPPFAKFKHICRNFNRVGCEFNLFKFLNPWKYHTSYDNYELYSDNDKKLFLVIV